MTVHRHLALACLAVAAVTGAADEPAAPTAAPGAGAASPPAAEAVAVPRSAFVAGARVGLLVPWGRATSDLSMTRYALLMSGMGLDLGWRPTRDVWLGAIGSAAVCFTCETTGQDLYRAGAAVAVRALRLSGTELDDVSLWVGAGIAEAWLQAEPVRGPSRRVRGPELTLPRLELHVAQRGMRFVAGLEVTVGRFTHDYSPGTGHALAASEQAVHGTVELSLRAAFEGTGPAEPPPAAGRGFLLAGGVGVGVPLAPPGSSVAFVAPVTLAIGYRFGPRVRASAVLDVAPGAPGGCAPAAGCEIALATLGAGVELHPGPASYRDPWLGLVVADELLLVDRREGGAAVTESWEGLLLRLEGGVQAYRSPRFAIGPYAALGVGVWMERELELGDATRRERLGRRLHGTATAGVRLAWLP